MLKRIVLLSLIASGLTFAKSEPKQGHGYLQSLFGQSHKAEKSKKQHGNHGHHGKEVKPKQCKD